MLTDVTPPQRSRERWLEVLARAREVARRTRFRGELRVLVLRALDVYEELFTLEHEAVPVRPREAREGRAAVSHRPQPAAPASARQRRQDSTLPSTSKLGGGSGVGTGCRRPQGVGG